MIWRERPVGLALVGCGQMGRVHAAAIAREKRAALVVVHDSDEERATEMAADFRGARAAPALEDVLSDERVEAVIFATPHHLHMAHVMVALQAGKHVLVEKPMALSAGDSRAMCERAEATGRRLLVGQVMRFWPNVDRAARAIAAGEIGEVRHVSRRRLVYQRDAGRPWAHDPEQAGGWLLQGITVHEVDAVLYLTGAAVTETFAMGARTNPIWQDIDELTAVFRLGDNAIASVVHTLNSQVSSLETVVVGERGSIFLSDFHRGYALNGARTPLGDDQGVGAQLREFIVAVRTGVPSRIDGQRILPTMVTLDLLRESLRTGVVQAHGLVRARAEVRA